MVVTVLNILKVNIYIYIKYGIYLFIALIIISYLINIIFVHK